MADPKPNKQSYTDLKLATCASAAVADKGPEKGVLSFEQSTASIGGLAPNQIDIPHATFQSNNGYAGVSARVGPPLNDKPTALSIDAHVGGSISTITVPDATNLDSTSVYSSGQAGAAAQRMATGVMNEVKACMASPAIPVAGSNKTFQVKPTF